MTDKITKALETVNELRGETLKKLDDDIVDRLRGRMEWWKDDCEDLRAAANEIERLRAENEKLNLELNDKDAKIVAQALENVKLRAALKPFADEGAGITDEHDDLPYDYGMGDCGCFTNGNLRAAAAALKEMNDDNN